MRCALAKSFAKSSRLRLPNKGAIQSAFRFPSGAFNCRLSAVWESFVSIDSIRTVAVLGAGTMGNGIAHVFARAGYNVILRDVEDRFLLRGMDTISKNLDREVKKGKLTDAEKPV